MVIMLSFFNRAIMLHALVLKLQRHRSQNQSDDGFRNPCGQLSGSRPSRQQHTPSPLFSISNDHVPMNRTTLSFIYYVVVGFVCHAWFGQQGHRQVKPACLGPVCHCTGRLRRSLRVPADFIETSGSDGL
jgi:hypothetical protein